MLTLNIIILVHMGAVLFTSLVAKPFIKQGKEKAHWRRRVQYLSGLLLASVVLNACCIGAFPTSYNALVGVVGFLLQTVILVVGIRESKAMYLKEKWNRSTNNAYYWIRKAKEQTAELSAKLENYKTQQIENEKLAFKYLEDAKRAIDKGDEEAERTAMEKKIECDDLADECRRKVVKFQAKIAEYEDTINLLTKEIERIEKEKKQQLEKIQYDEAMKKAGKGIEVAKKKLKKSLYEIRKEA